MINNDLQLKEILIEGYLDEMCYIERLLKSPNSKEVRLKGGLDRLSKKLRYIKNRLLEVRPPRFPETLYRKIIRRYRDPIKAYKVMWSLHNKHRDKLDEMWLAFEGKLNESLNSDNNCGLPLIKRGFIGESPDHLFCMNKALHWDDEDAMSIVIFMDTAIVRGHGDCHKDMLTKFGDFCKELVEGHIREDKLTYGKKMLLPIYGSTRAFYFGRVINRQFFVEFNAYFKRMRYSPSAVCQDLDTGRVWTDSKVISFWGNGNTEKNVELTAEALNLSPDELNRENHFGNVVNSNQLQLSA